MFVVVVVSFFLPGLAVMGTSVRSNIWYRIPPNTQYEFLFYFGAPIFDHGTFDCGSINRTNLTAWQFYRRAIYPPYILTATKFVIHLIRSLPRLTTKWVVIAKMWPPPFFKVLFDFQWCSFLIKTNNEMLNCFLFIFFSPSLSSSVFLLYHPLLFSLLIVFYILLPKKSKLRGLLAGKISDSDLIGKSVSEELLFRYDSLYLKNVIYAFRRYGVVNLHDDQTGWWSNSLAVK